MKICRLAGPIALAIGLWLLPELAVGLRPPELRPGDILARNLAAGGVLDPTELVVWIAPGVSRAELVGAVRKVGCEVRRRFGQRPLYLLGCSGDRPFAALLRALADRPEVSWVEPSYRERQEEPPNDLSLAQWHHENVGQVIDGVVGLPGADIGSVAAWEVISPTWEPVIAIVDNGIRPDHEDLASVLWSNDDEDCSNGLDDDGNGYVDDCAGWDVGEDDNDPDPTTLPLVDSDGDNCKRWHGTFMAGLAAAETNNGRGMAGVSRSARLMSIKKHRDDTCGATTARSIEAVAYAVDNGANILALSFSSSSYDATFEALLQEADANGVITVMSAGNDGEDVDVVARYPNDYELTHGLIVANTTNRDELRSSSNYGSEKVHLAAPGTDLWSAGMETPQSYELHSGTSYSGPLVAGAVAMIWSTFPELWATDVKASIVGGVELLDALDCAQESRCVASGGRLDLLGAVREAATFAPRLRIGFIDLTDGSGGDGDGLLEPGESARLTYVLLNLGRHAAWDANVELRLLDDHEELTVSNRTTTAATVPGEGFVEVIDDAPSFLLDETCDQNNTVSLEIEVTASNAESFVETTNLELTCEVDLDGDGSVRPLDCDDRDPNRYPSARELCDGIDNDCDDRIDEVADCVEGGIRPPGSAGPATGCGCSWGSNGASVGLVTLLFLAMRPKRRRFSV